MPSSEQPTTPINTAAEAPQPRTPASMASRIALAYLSFGVAWIFITDRALIWLNVPAHRVAQIQTSKGWLFVFASAALLYLLVSVMQRRNDASLQALSERESEIRRMNAELERRVAQRTAELEATNRELESFAYAVSHDLRAPLRSMSGFSQLLQDSPTDALDEKSRHYLHRINDASKRMSTLIEDLLGLSRISRSELIPRKIDFSQLTADVVAIVRERHPDRNVDVQIERDMTVEGDPRLLKIAMENLLDNAWKYTTHTLAAKICIGSQRDEQGSTYYVRDNGVGFDMAYSSKLFGPFQRLHSDAQYPGTGIGLVTVQRILARHGGRIWVHAELNYGATFYFTLAQSRDATTDIKVSA
jgi:light-regulated signal transduction histidine kinase (bacteriophytochrome)